MSTGPSRTVRRTTVLTAPADVVWHAVRQPATLVHVAAPLLRMPELEGRTAPWTPGDSVTTRLRLLGVVPLHRHTVTIELVDDARHTLQTDERGGPLTVWRHRITVEPVDPGSCRYTDEVLVGAGRLTGAAHLLVRVFYRWRHLRWRRLAPVLAATALP
ncbi:MAG: hypothetical protein JHC71_04755 [Blastococcus sp.]|nr:hypothetical protein [Blastococcus sp.]